VVLGVRPTDFEHGATAEAELPRVRVKADVVEDLGSESHVIFSIDAPRVTAEAVRAATEHNEDEGQLFAGDRAIFTACLDARRPVVNGEEVELAIDYRRLHFFDPATGHALGTAA
jgi:multiple sugar transport system ATP-binding protein